jgi:hypothetical protein
MLAGNVSYLHSEPSGLGGERSEKQKDIGISLLAEFSLLLSPYHYLCIRPQNMASDRPCTGCQNIQAEYL